MADYDFILVEQSDDIGTITLNRPEVMNAWNAQMRKELADALATFDADEGVRAIILTGAGDKAFCAGQDLNETKTFDPDRAELWIGEWRHLYGVIRNLTKPLVCALNGVAAGSAFQVSLLTDIRIGHPGVRMGQPEINSGIASTLGPWIMREMLGLSRTIELTLTGRIMDAEEANQIGLIHEIVPQDQVQSRAREVARLLADKPPVAMRLNKRRFRDVTQAAFEDALEAGVRHQREAYGSGEPQRMMEKFFEERAKKKAS
jgi:enoyl-CoA hydratase/carnithine racemase